MKPMMSPAAAEPLARATRDDDRCTPRAAHTASAEADGHVVGLLRRALDSGDEFSRRVFRELYGDTLLGWCVAAGAADGAGELAARAWVKFWRGCPRSSLTDGPTVALALRYLKLCAWSAATDAARARQAAAGGGGASRGREAVGSNQVEFAGRVLAELATEQERALLRLLYAQGLDAAAASAARPDLFPTPAAVRSARAALHARLRTSAVCAAALSLQEP